MRNQRRASSDTTNETLRQETEFEWIKRMKAGRSDLAWAESSTLRRERICRKLRHGPRDCPSAHGAARKGREIKPTPGRADRFWVSDIFCS